VIAVQMDRLCYISVAHHIAAVEERHHRRNPFNLTPCAYPKTLNGTARRTGHPIRVNRLLRQGCAYRRRALTSRKRRELAAR
jgi:hypothetical protein